MSPAVGPLGYPDWQRIENWDGPVLYQFPVGSSSLTQSSPLLSVAHFQTVAGTFTASAGKIQAQFVWYADQAQTIQLGTRAFYIDGGPNGQMQYRFVNLGPWLQVTIYGKAIPYTLFAPMAIAVSNRAFPTELVAPDPVLAQQSALAIGAGLSSNQQIPPLVSGRCVLWTFSTLAGVVFNVQNLALGTTYEDLFQLVTPAANTNVSGEFEAPSSSLQLMVNNPNGSGTTVYYALVHSGGVA